MEPLKNNLDSEKTIALDPVQLSDTTARMDSPLKHISAAPEVAGRRSFRGMLRHWWGRSIQELRDVDSEITSGIAVRCSFVNCEGTPPKNMFKLSDIYEVGEVFAQGGQSIIRCAEDIRFGRMVAIKTLRLNSGDPEAARLAFIREAQITSQLDHPAILPIYSLTRDPDGSMHLAMKHVVGETMQKYLQQLVQLYEENGFEQYDERKNLYLRLDYFLRVCDAMVYAHARNVVHCDLKPENIMIGKYREVYVMDWGIARAIDDGREWVPPNSISGTLRYMAPEIIAGGRPGVQSDVFSLGTILYEITTLNNAFSGRDSAAIIRNIKSGGIGGFHHRFGYLFLRELKGIIRKATAPDPLDRYVSVSDIAADIRKALRSEDTSISRNNPAERFVHWCARNPKIIVLSFLGLLIFALVGLGVSMARELGSMARQKAYDAAVANVFAKSMLAAQQINNRFAGTVQLLDSVNAEFLLQRSGGGSGTGLKNTRFSHDLNAEPSPPSYSWAPAYHRKVDFSCLSWTTASAGGTPESEQKIRINLEALDALVFRFRQIFFRRGDGADSGFSDPVYAEQQIRRNGTSPHVLAFGFPDGLFCIYPGTGDGNRGFDPRKSYWYQNAANVWSHQYVWSRPSAGSFRNAGYGIACSTPIYDSDGRFIGASAAVLSIPFLEKEIFGFGNTGEMVRGKYIFDPGGNILLSPDRKGAIPGSVRLRSMVVELALRRKLGYCVESIGGKNYLWNFFFLASPRWYYAECIDIDCMMTQLSLRKKCEPAGPEKFLCR